MDRTEQNIDDALATVTAEIGRTDTKASLLLALDGALVAAIGALGHVPPTGRLLVAVGVACLIPAAALAILVVKPRLKVGRTSTAGFVEWADSDPEELRSALAHDHRPVRIKTLSQICRRKMRLLVWSTALSLVALVALAAAGVASAA